MQYYILVLIFSALLLPGIIGSALSMPGLPYMFLIALVFGFVDKFQHLSIIELVYLGIVATAAILVDYLSGVLGAKFSGATRNGVIGGILGFALGLILFPPFGGFIGLFLGIFIIELTNFAHWKKALKAASGSLIGTLTGIGINMLLAAIFTILFVLFSIK